LKLFDQNDRFGHNIRIYLSGLYFYAVHFFYFGGNFITFGFGTAGQHYFAEHVAVHSAFVRYHASNTTGTND
jgi:hypothetical protein